MTALPAIPGPTAAECCVPSAGENPTLRADRLASLAKALSEPLRVRIVDLLRRSEEPVCQCELIALYGIKQSLLSHHMKKLTAAGLVAVERRHRWAYYSLAPGAFDEISSWLT